MHKFFVFAVFALFAMSFKPNFTSSDPEIPSDVQALLEKYGCTGCHAMSRKLVGPQWTDIAAKGYNKKKIATLVAKPQPANWPGFVPMMPQNVAKADMDKIATWLAKLNK